MAILLLFAVSVSVGETSSRKSGQGRLRSGTAPTMLDLVNRARAEGRVCGDKEFQPASPFHWNDRLANSSLKHAEDMARRNYFSHTSKNGNTLADRVKREKYRFRKIGENIASTSDATEAVELWLKSPGHCANIMDPEFTEMGAAFATNSAKVWKTRWVQVLGKEREQ